MILNEKVMIDLERPLREVEVLAWHTQWTIPVQEVAGNGDEIGEIKWRSFGVRKGDWPKTEASRENKRKVRGKFSYFFWDFSSHASSRS